MKHSKMYNRMPGKATEKVVRIAYPALTSVGSISKKSAMPPHTPASILSDDLVNLLCIIIELFFI